MSKNIWQGLMTYDVFDACFVCVCVCCIFFWFAIFFGWVAVGGGEVLGKREGQIPDILNKRSFRRSHSLLFEIMSRSVRGGFKDFC